MKLKVQRSLAEIKQVLKDPDVTSGPDPGYWVFSDIGGVWQNMTVIPSGNYNGEFTKTVGHYHLNPVSDENYYVVSGAAVFVLQKKHFDEKNKFTPELVSEVQVKRVKAGESIHISGDYGHAVVNIGDGPLITYDDRVEPHSPEDYEPVTRLHGLAYYIIKEGDKVKVVPNPNYKNLESAILEDSLQ